MEIFLARHGNTFENSSEAYWAGCQQDIPLTKRGREQAEQLARYLLRSSSFPDYVFTSELKRTKSFAKILLHSMSLPIEPIVDPRLNEIDYGSWGGLTSEQLRQKGLGQLVENWQERSQWPAEGQWQNTEQEILERTAEFTMDLQRSFRRAKRVLVVSSNGILRYFLKLADQEFERRAHDGRFTVGTGNLCKISSSEEGKHRVIFWNVDPQTIGGNG